MLSIEFFLPLYERLSTWKNRQQVKLLLPLFPAYLFARIGRQDRAKVLNTPGVIRIVGNKQDYLSLPDHEINYLKESLVQNKAEPCQGIVNGDRVRLKRGALQGIEGTLLRSNNGTKFILTIELINQHASIDINIDDVEPVFA